MRVAAFGLAAGFRMMSAPNRLSGRSNVSRGRCWPLLVS